jgi:hypothetical protein
MKTSDGESMVPVLDVDRDGTDYRSSMRGIAMEC